MGALLVLAGIGIAAGDVWLGVASYRTRTALAGLLALAGVGLVAFADASGVVAGRAEAALIGALICTLLGSVLYLLGQVFERLLAEPEPEGNWDGEA